MAAGQQFLFAPEKPLVKRLGTAFFRKIPRRAGVYKMRDAQDNIVYVGKAKNLRQRLGSYRVANPERLGRRHLRLLQAVTRIEFDLCANESAALQHEARLIRELKPRFNRAGVWQGKSQFLAWRWAGGALEFSVVEVPLPGYDRVGSLGAYAVRLKAVLVRLLWLAGNPGAGFHKMPCGWSQDRMQAITKVSFTGEPMELRHRLTTAFWGGHSSFLGWLREQLNSDRSAFERNAAMSDLEELAEFFERQTRLEQRSNQLALL